MGLMTSKWLIGAVAVVGILLIAAFTGRKSVHSEIFIPASPATVWQVLMDTAAYREWNPVLVPLEGELAEGNTVKYEYLQEPGKSYVLNAAVRDITEAERLNQTGGTFGILTFDHNYLARIIHEKGRTSFNPLIKWVLRQ